MGVEIVLSLIEKQVKYDIKPQNKPEKRINFTGPKTIKNLFKKYIKPILKNCLTYDCQSLNIYDH